MTTNSTTQHAIQKTLQIYLRHIMAHWKITLPIALLVTVGTILIFYVPPLVIAHIINSASDFHTVTLSNGWLYLVWFGGAWLAGEMLWRLVFFLTQRYEVAAFKDFYSLAMDDLLQKDVGFFSNRFTGSITKNTIAFGRRFESFFDTIIFEVVANIGPALFGLVVLAFISPLLSIALVVLMAVSILIVRPLLKRRLKLVRIREDRHSVLAGHISDVVTNLAAVKSHGLEDTERTTHDKHVIAYTDAAMQSWHYHNTRVDMVVSPLYVLINVVGLAIILSVGVDNATKAGLFLAFSYYSTFSRFLWSFNSVYRRLEEAVTEAALFTDYLLTRPRVHDAPHAKQLVITQGEIAFRNVEFTHHENDVEALFSKLNATILPGQRVGLVGHSGAGKSTLVALLERFVNVDGGEILIDGQNIAEVTQQSLHQSIAYVPQEPVLFHRSIRENIGYGKPGASRDDIRRAAKQANALSFIEKLPHGFDTMVGERGVKLSGGQRQRIAIARAILKDAPILILDEATSALDSESEKLIQDSLETLMKGRTSIVIAHRLSTIAKLDRIIVLDNGSIVEDGSHTELLTQHGVYASLWKHQSGGFIDE